MQGFLYFTLPFKFILFVIKRFYAEKGHNYHKWVKTEQFLVIIHDAYFNIQ